MPSFIFIQNRDQPIDAPARIRICSSFACRLRGLMFRSGIDPNEGLLLQISRDSRLDSSIHMLFVPFALAVVWIDSGLEVVDKILAQPWRPAYFPARAARYVLEMHPDRLGQYSIGHKVEFVRA